MYWLAVFVRYLFGTLLGRWDSVSSGPRATDEPVPPAGDGDGDPGFRLDDVSPCLEKLDGPPGCSASRPRIGSVWGTRRALFGLRPTLLPASGLPQFPLIFSRCSLPCALSSTR